MYFLRYIFLKVEHFSESLSNWAKNRFQVEIWAKSEAGGAYSGGAYIKKACSLEIFKINQNTYLEPNQ